MKRLAHLFLLTLIIVSLSLNSCKKDNGATANNFPVNNTFAMELMAKGIPADVAQFFAAAKMDISKPNDSTCIYLQTFPNKATSGSMASSGKMTALKTASQNLLTQLKSAAVTADDVYVSVIPFGKDVNVDPSNVNASWLRWDLWEEVNGKCSDTSYHSKTNCLSHSKVWKPAAHSTWNGCVTDRDQNFDTTNGAPVAGATLYPTEQYSSCAVSLIGLSNNWTTLSSKIDAMQPNGNTNQAIGLQMGWQSLTAAPFSVPALDPDYKYNQVIILLSDGLNTEDRWYTTASSIDTRQQKACDNIKAAGITIYTVQVNTGSDPTSTLLKNCASDTSKFFLLTSSAEIVTTFGQIGTALSNLRLAM